LSYGPKTPSPGTDLRHPTEPQDTPPPKQRLPARESDQHAKKRLAPPLGIARPLHFSTTAEAA